MHIEIETPTVENNNFPNNNRTGEQWYVVAQEALLFREGEKYPDKFVINLYFQSHKTMEAGLTAQKSIVPLKAGKYTLEDKAFYVNNRSQLTLDVLRLKAA
jgi:hypothetical protein